MFNLHDILDMLNIHHTQCRFESTNDIFLIGVGGVFTCNRFHHQFHQERYIKTNRNSCRMDRNLIEIWKDVKGYEGLYQVSNLGNVKSMNYNHTGKEHILSPVIDKGGYSIITLHKDGKQKIHKVHSLVAEMFIPNPDNLPQVNHKDENKQNNFVGTPENKYTDGNLEWCDGKYNINYGSCIERRRKKQINNNKCQPVYQFTIDGDFIKEYPSFIEIERQLGYDRSFISRVCRGFKSNNTAYGFIWKLNK